MGRSVSAAALSGGGKRWVLVFGCCFFCSPEKGLVQRAPKLAFYPSHPKSYVPSVSYDGTRLVLPCHHRADPKRVDILKADMRRIRAAQQERAAKAAAEAPKVKREKEKKREERKSAAEQGYNPFNPTESSFRGGGGGGGGYRPNMTERYGRRGGGG